MTMRRQSVCINVHAPTCKIQYRLCSRHNYVSTCTHLHIYMYMYMQDNVHKSTREICTQCTRCRLSSASGGAEYGSLPSVWRGLEHSSLPLPHSLPSHHLPPPPLWQRMVNMICERIWENPTFAYMYSIKIEILLYLASESSVLSKSIYNSTISELQHFVMQPFILPVLQIQSHIKKMYSRIAGWQLNVNEV